MTSISAIRNSLCVQAKNQMDSLQKVAKAKNLDIKRIIEEDIPPSKYTSIDETFNSTKGNINGGNTIFKDTSTQKYMGKQHAQLFAVKDVKTYYEQMCLSLPQLFGTDPTVYKGTSSYEYDPDNFDFSKKCPSGTTIYSKPDDSGKHNKIAIIDCFNSNNEDVCMYLDCTTDTMITHGEFVASLVESQVAEYGLNYEVERLGVDIVDGEIQKGVAMMNYVLDNIEDYRGVNLSIVAYCDYDTVSDLLGETVTPSNLASKKEKIMKIVTSDATTSFYEEYKDTLDKGYLPDFSNMVKSGSITQADADSLSALLQLRCLFEVYGEFYAVADEIASQGIPVFMASGNYSDKFNFGALLTNKVEYIGANSDTYTNPYTGGKGSFSNNSLVSRKGETTYTGNNVIYGKIDVDNNGSGDVSAKGVDTSTVFATGTSFSSPAELVKAIYKGDTSSSSQTAAAEIGANNQENKQSINKSHLTNFVTLNTNKNPGVKNSTNTKTQEKATVNNTEEEKTYGYMPVSKKKSNVLNSASKFKKQSLNSNSQAQNKILDNKNTNLDKSWSPIISDLNSKIDYNTSSTGTTAEKTKDMNFKQLSAYFASKMSQEALSAGYNYFNNGKGKIWRYTLPNT